MRMHTAISLRMLHITSISPPKEDVRMSNYLEKTIGSAPIMHSRLLLTSEVHMINHQIGAKTICAVADNLVSIISKFTSAIRMDY